MRPSEIDYTSRVKHYFDISNGEVIAGEATQEYLQTCVDPDNVRELGELLCQPFLDIAQINYETLDSSNWSKEKYLLFGHWFKHIVPPPAEGHKQLTRQMLITGRKLGVVPPIRTLLREFGGKYGDFYVAIEASNTRTIGQFKDWALEDFVAYIRKVGGERMPTLAVFDNLHKSNPTKPSGTYMRDRFSNIGSFSKLLELAGYPVIGLWEKNDYTEWGVKFMQANNGIVPTAIMTDYFSFRRLGPSSTSIRNNFIRTGLFQREVGRNYTEHERKAQQSRQEKRDLIEAELSQGIIPVELFLPGNSVDSRMPSPEQAVAMCQQALGSGGLIETAAARYYAKYKVLENIVPALSIENRCAISRDEVDRSFVASIMKYRKEITPGEIEHTALTMGLFDDIWPMDDHLQTLKLDAGYEDYYRKRTKIKKRRFVSHLVEQTA